MEATTTAGMPEIPSPDDLEEAHDILAFHLPRYVSRKVCTCGEPYPCQDVRFATVLTEAVDS